MKHEEEGFLVAAWKNKAGLIQKYVNKKININVSDKQGDTALHYAANFGFAEIAQLLLKNGATVFAQNRFRQTPLHMAASNGHAEIAQLLLLESGTNEEARDINGASALDLSTKAGHPEVSRVIADSLWKKGRI